MPRFQALDELLDGNLELPVGRKVYVIEAPSAETGLYCQRYVAAMKNAATTSVKLQKQLAAAAGDDADDQAMADLIDDDAIELLSDHDEAQMYQRVLGDTYQQLIDDKVSWPTMKRVALTAFWWIVAGDERAEQFWKNGEAAGKALSPTKTSRNTGGGTSTRRRASTTTTKSRTKSSPRQQTKG
jgi:hypothetical protein